MQSFDVYCNFLTDPAQVTGLSLKQLDVMGGGAGEDIGCVVCSYSADSDVVKLQPSIEESHPPSWAA